MARAGKWRLDLCLAERGLVESRERARAVIMAGAVTVNGQVAIKPGQLVSQEAALSVQRSFAYVSRGGVKLAHALDAFSLSVQGCTALDVGASTGGFTDVLLQRGARRVYAVDVGYGQLHWRLRRDPRVVVLERTNARYLEALPEPVDLAVIDVSFISLKLILPPVKRLLGQPAAVVALVKPQFEAGRRQVSRGGVVRDPSVHRQVLQQTIGCARELGYALAGLTASPLLGPAGNREFLLYLRLDGGASRPVDQLVEAALQSGAIGQA